MEISEEIRMGEKQQLLRDATVTPTEKLISAGLGEATILYEEFIRNIKSQGITLMDWRFYNDGKAWLSKGEYKWTTSRGSQKVKPIFWLSIWDGFFKVSFHFPEKMREKLVTLSLSEGTKEKIKTLQANGNQRKHLSVIFDVDHLEQLADIYQLAEFKKQNGQSSLYSQSIRYQRTKRKFFLSIASLTVDDSFKINETALQGNCSR